MFIKSDFDMSRVELRPIEHWDTVHSELKRFEVLLDGEVIGTIEQFYPTFERKPRGSRVVTKRWTSNTPYWTYDAASQRTHNPYQSPERVKKTAILALIESHMWAQERGR